MAESSDVNLWELSDLTTPWCIYVAATLRIAEHIDAGIDRIDDLARAARCDPHVLHAVLGHLVNKGVFEWLSPGRFGLNAAARQFLDPVTRMALNLDGLGGRMAHAWSTLLTLVRSGEPGYKDLFGRPFFDDLAAHPEISAEFDALIGPAGHGVPSPYFDLSTGWGGVRVVADVGGGTGAMLAEILKARPGVKGILVDQPATVARSAEIFQAAGVSDRVQTVGQSFFDPLPAGADVYLLKGIINDWPDREAVAILSRCAEAAGKEGGEPKDRRVVVLGGVRGDGALPDVVIEMVLVGGRIRTLQEMEELGKKSGLAVVKAGKQGDGYWVVEYKAV